jgi:gliding motility-associated-like protein
MNMKRFTLSLLAICYSAFAFAQQPITDGAITPEEAVEILLGSGVDAFNITFSGDMNQIGSYECTDCGIGIPNGVVLASGSVDVVSGPNNSGSQTTGGGNFGISDPDLDILSTFGTNDAVVLEFDFIPQGDSIKFNYVFGSEEYNEYVCGTVNDAFGFFLSGPGIAGGQGFQNDAINLAIIPGTDIPVTINTVNLGVSGTNGTPSNCESVSPDWDQNSEFYVDNDNNNDPNTTQLDGHTVILEASAQVVCNEVYHIKIAIADAGDTAFDSGVFLESDSFTSDQVTIEGSASIDTPIFLGDSVLVEGCNTANFSLVRPNSSEEVTITIGIGGTAENGVDYVPALGTEYTFEIGENVLELPEFSAVQDGIDEDPETIELSYTFINGCGEEVTITEILYIQEYEQPTVVAEDVVSPCPGSTVDVTAVGTGYAPFTYVWSTEEEGATIQVSPDDDTSYSVEATDVCGTSVSTDVDVSVLQDPPPVILVPQEDVELGCPGDAAFIEAVVESGSPDYSYEWSNNAQTAATTVFPNETSTFVVLVTDACFQTATDSIDVIVPEAEPFIADVLIDELPECPGDPFTLTADVSGGFPTYSYNWSPGFGFNQDFTPNPAPTVTTTYTLTVFDACFQDANTTFVVEMPVADPPLSVTAEALDEPLCPGDPVQFTGSASGGFGSDPTLSWNGAVTPDGTATFNPNSTQTFTFSAVDACGITVSEGVQVIVPQYDALTVDVDAGSAYCPGDDVLAEASASGGLEPYAYAWSTGGDGEATVVNPTTPGGDSYSISVTDGCGVETVEDYFVPVEEFAPIFVTAITDLCAGGISEIDEITGGAQPYNLGDAFSEPIGVFVNPDSSFINPPQGTYELIVVDACGNTGSTFFETVTCETIIPNIISPNGDDVNEEFIIQFIEYFPGSVLRIWNRWGAMVYQSTNYKNSEPFDGSGLSDGTYYYELSRSDGEQFTGDLTITR